MVDVEKLDLLIDHYNSITESRTKRAVAAMSSVGRYIYEIIPILLHYNHPLLPGFIPGNTPHGISGFVLSEYQQEYIDRMINVTNCDIDIHSQGAAIVSLYTMGSTSSIGQTSVSDIDIWVCHSPNINKEELKLLEQKCGVISNLAQTRDVEVNFFLVPTNKFRIPNESSVDSENCGSALHLLLLEEFYRTALWIAGKKLIWYLVPEEEENINYDEYVETLFQEKLVSRDDWFDLGPINKIPGQEFLGSALWLMYKGVDYPYKAVLKILLMEAYSVEYPNVKLIANDVRRKLIKYKSYDLDIDAYNLVYLKIKQYLDGIGDKERLLLLQKCFYQKISEDLNFNDNSVYMQLHKNVVEQFVNASHLTKEDLALYGNRNKWNICTVNQAYDSIIKTMLTSYHKLRDFSEKIDAANAMTSRDLSILSRKLSSAFDVKDNKIRIVNLNMAPNIGEQKISLIYVAQGKISRSGWYLYPSSLEPHEIIKHKCAYYHKNIVNVIAWAFANHVLTESTNIYYTGGNIDNLSDILPILTSIFADYRNRFLKTPVTTEDFINPWYYKNITVLINVDKDASRESDKNEIVLNNVDILSFGSDSHSLVASIDLIYRNSWNELFVKHYDGDNGFIEFLEDGLNTRNPHGKEFNNENFEVHCFSNYLSGVIRQQVYDFILDAVSIIEKGESNQNYKVFMLGGKSYSIINSHKHISIVPLNNTLELFHVLENSQIEQQRQLENSPYIEIIYQFASLGILQFFFEDLDEGFRVYLLDEDNKLMSFVYQKLTKDGFVAQINKKVVDTNENAKGESAKFGLPQFYQLSNNNGEISISTYS